MSNRKKIDALLRQVAELEAAEKRNNRDAEILQVVYAELQEKLKGNGVTLDSFVRFAQRDIRKAIAKIDREVEKEQKAQEGAAAPAKEAAPKKGRGGRRAGTKKAAPVVGAKKKPGRKKGGKAAAENIKIAPGRYTNVPPDMEKVFDIKEKGARPKAVKVYAMQIGLDAFNEQCRMAE